MINTLDFVSRRPVYLAISPFEQVTVHMAYPLSGRLGLRGAEHAFSLGML
ncbi:MAG: hypothetical protein ACREX4_21035 [Gammaproteobacteria bacterium]